MNKGKMYIGGGNWIDWMKALGMFFIVWGHLSPVHLKDVIYAFNVQAEKVLVALLAIRIKKHDKKLFFL